MGVIIPGDFKVVHIKRYFAFVNVFVLTRFHCIPQDGDSAVIVATTNYRLPVLKELVRAGADLNLQNQVT